MLLQMQKASKWTLTALMVALLCGLAVAGDKAPYKATLASTNVQILPPGVEGNDCPELPNVPADIGIFKFIITAVGNSTLMGLTVDVQSHCAFMPLDPNAPPPPPGTPPAPFFNGLATLTGANGDKIFGTYSGFLSVTEQGLVIDGTLITTGGTGRFKGATGEGKAFGVQTLEGDAALTLTGTLSTPGAIKK